MPRLEIAGGADEPGPLVLVPPSLSSRTGPRTDCRPAGSPSPSILDGTDSELWLQAKATSGPVMMTNASCTLTPAPVTRWLHRLIILSATGRARPQPGNLLTHALCWSLRDLLASNLATSTLLAPGTGNPAACCLSPEGISQKSPHDACLRASQLAPRHASSSASASDKRPGDKGPVTERERLRRPGLRPYHLTKKKKKKKKKKKGASSSSSSSTRGPPPQVPRHRCMGFLWPPVEMLRCAVPVRRAGSRRG